MRSPRIAVGTQQCVLYDTTYSLYSTALTEAIFLKKIVCLVHLCQNKLFKVTTKLGLGFKVVFKRAIGLRWLLRITDALFNYNASVFV